MALRGPTDVPQVWAQKLVAHVVNTIEIESPMSTWKTEIVANTSPEETKKLSSSRDESVQLVKKLPHSKEAEKKFAVFLPEKFYGGVLIAQNVAAQIWELFAYLKNKMGRKSDDCTEEEKVRGEIPDSSVPFCLNVYWSSRVHSQMNANL